MNRFDLLLTKFRNQSCTSKELEELLDYLASQEHEPELKEAIERQLYKLPDESQQVDAETGKILQNINLQINRSLHAPFYRRYWWAAAAAMLVFGTFGILKVISKKAASVVSEVQVEKTQIMPGGNRAVLTLANGKTISLTEAANGLLARDGGVSVKKSADGELEYFAENSGGDYANGLNTLSVPKGGTYDVTLADGTHVWLNSGSSMIFPTSFSGQDRLVELTGEGYFEVARNGKPFKVQTATQTVQVLGTHFNVEAYPDENIVKTTLIEGSVKVLKGKENILLIPGQTGINKEQAALFTSKADLEQVMAWKNGLFVFDNETIAEIMRKATRWYDIEVSYENNVDQKRLMGTVSKYKSINELLDNIALAGNLRYKIEGRRVLLMK